MDTNQRFSCSFSAQPMIQESPFGHNNRARFVLFVKLLLDRLRDSGDIVLLEQAKLLVHHCTYRNRLGDPAYCPLAETTELRLRSLVGEFRWEIIQAETSLVFAQRSSMMKRSQPQGIVLRP
jgi:hypothetical protein